MAKYGFIILSLVSIFPTMMSVGIQAMDESDSPMVHYDRATGRVLPSSGDLGSGSASVGGTPRKGKKKRPQVTVPPPPRCEPPALGHYYREVPGTAYAELHLASATKASIGLYFRLPREPLSPQVDPVFFHLPEMSYAFDAESCKIVFTNSSGRMLVLGDQGGVVKSLDSITAMIEIFQSRLPHVGIPSEPNAGVAKDSITLMGLFDVERVNGPVDWPQLIYAQKEFNGLAVSPRDVEEVRTFLGLETPQATEITTTEPATEEKWMTTRMRGGNGFKALSLIVPLMVVFI